MKTILISDDLITITIDNEKPSGRTGMDISSEVVDELTPKEKTLKIRLMSDGYFKKVIPENTILDEFVSQLGLSKTEKNIFESYLEKVQTSSKSPLGERFSKHTYVELTEEEWSGAKKMFGAFKKIMPSEAFVTGLGVYNEC